MNVAKMAAVSIGNSNKLAGSPLAAQFTRIKSQAAHWLRWQLEFNSRQPTGYAGNSNLIAGSPLAVHLT